MLVCANMVNTFVPPSHTSRTDTG